MSITAFQILGVPDIEDLEQGQEVIRHGLASTSLRQLAQRYDVSLEQMGRLVGIPKATLTRRLQARRPLPIQEADRAYRLARIYSYAADVFDDEAKAREWFFRRNRALGGDKPFDLLDTQPGVERVERVLSRIEQGTFS
ncbi:MAG TPA: antitoxin Xre/MbcA/ParS toxin-binding domain-containing protein [Candidatus Baltobacteraceae bacterium]|jgi:putative toxin-antitoxin system antitoxin component (TIGR02293 family)|nr:antitoxin Xre/MbcA/ParS toxin-binding domain-containing protein [Candidatus Baltobacteraceae bacterium]